MYFLGDRSYLDFAFIWICFCFHEYGNYVYFQSQCSACLYNIQLIAIIAPLYLGFCFG